MRSHLLSMTIIAAAVVVPSASASICSDANDCTFAFDVHNVGPTTFGSGPYGTLNLQLVGNTIQATIDLADGFGLINTGFPNGPGTSYAFGFNDNLAAADFSYDSYNPNTYNGGTTTAGTYQFDGFGNFDRAAAHTDLANTGGANVVSFIITRTGGFDSVQNLVGQSSGNIYFAADVFYNGINTPGSGCPTQSSCTGLIGVSGGGSPVPEPISSALVGTGLISLFFLRRRTNR